MYWFLYIEADKKFKVWEEGVDAVNIPFRVYDKEIRRHKLENSRPGPIRLILMFSNTHANRYVYYRRTAYYLAYGGTGIVAEIIYKNKLRHLIFQIGKSQRALIKG